MIPNIHIVKVKLHFFHEITLGKDLTLLPQMTLRGDLK